MSRPSKTDQELGAIKDWWTEVRTLEAEYHGTFLMYISALGRPGTFAFRMVFVPLLGGEENHMGTQALEFLYPNAEQSTLAGFLWRKAITLGRMVHEQDEKVHLGPKKRG